MVMESLVHLNINEISPELNEKHDRYVNEETMPLLFRHPALLRSARYKLLISQLPLPANIPRPEGIYGENLHIYQFRGEEAFRVFDYSVELQEVKMRTAAKWGAKLKVKFRAQYKTRKIWESSKKAQSEVIQLLGVNVPQEKQVEFREWSDTVYMPILLRNPKLLGLTWYQLVTGINNPDHPFAKRLDEYPTDLAIGSFQDVQSFLAYVCGREVKTASKEMDSILRQSAVKILMRAEYLLTRAWTR